jgi:hypothetical protein
MREKPDRESKKEKKTRRTTSRTTLGIVVEVPNH